MPPWHQMWFINWQVCDYGLVCPSSENIVFGAHCFVFFLSFFFVIVVENRQLCNSCVLSHSIEMAESHNGSTVVINAGQRISVALVAIPTAGYVWFENAFLSKIDCCC